MVPSSTTAPRTLVVALLVALVLTPALAAAQPTQAPLPDPPLPDVPAEVDSAPTPWWSDAVCYEVFVRSFSDSDGDGIGDLPGLIERFDYLNDGDPAAGTDLGVTCLWLMPIFPSPSYHGYDVTNHYKVNPDYGTLDDFRRLVDLAHSRGVRILLDLVLNHTSREHPWFLEAQRDPASPYRDWYVWSDDAPGYLGPWGQPVWHANPARPEHYYGIFWEGMPDLNYENPAVTAEALRVSAFWLNEVGADGFRLDAIKHLIEDGRVQENTPATLDWIDRYADWLAEAAPHAFTLGEIFGATPATLEPYYPDGLTSFFNFQPGEAVLAAANYGAAGQVVPALEAAAELPAERWAPFLTNHDQPRVMTVLDGDVAEARIAATALLTLPGLPFVYYGEEIGLAGDKPDERIRTPMQWTADPDGGFTAGTPWQPLQPDLATANVATQTDEPASLLNHYRGLIRLHLDHPALRHGDLVPLETGERTVVAYLRRAAGETLLVVLNFGKQPVEAAALAAGPSALSPGTYRPGLAFGEASTVPLTVGGDGSFAGYVPYPVLAPQTGYVVALAP